MSLSELSLNPSVKGTQGGINRINHSISQVGKAGLPPLLRNRAAINDHFPVHKAVL